MTVHVRAAAEKDVEPIRHLGHQTWPPTYAFAPDAYVAHGLETWWSSDAIQRSLERTKTLVAELDGRVVGMGNLDLRQDPPTIWKLYVLPTCQSAGVGSVLLEHLLALVPQGQRRVALEYTEGNHRAAAFYARHGFVEVRREPADLPGWPAAVWLERTVTGPE